MNFIITRYDMGLDLFQVHLHLQMYTPSNAYWVFLSRPHTHFTLVVSTCDGDDKEQSKFLFIVVGSSLMLTTTMETWVLVN